MPVANVIFTPTPEELAEARAIIADYRRAEDGGTGAIGRNGKLVDAALMRRGERIAQSSSRGKRRA